MNLAERAQAQETLVSLLNDASRDPGHHTEAGELAVWLARVVGSVPQTWLVQRTGRSRPTIAALCHTGVLRRDAAGHVDALDAALAVLALEGSGRSRRLRERYAEIADWFDELRDPAFREGLQQAVEGDVQLVARPVVPAEERAARKRAFLEAQAAAAESPRA